MGLFEKVFCGVCGNRIKGQYVRIKDLKRNTYAYNLCVSCNEKFKMITQGKVEYPMIPEKTKQIIENGMDAAGVIENRMRCNVCGEIFCYTDDDIARNRALLQDADRARKSAMMELLGGTRLAANQHSARADSYEAQIVDFSKCPKCNSTDLVAVSKEEFEAIKNKQANGGNAVTSSADEFKKFKDLLDSGVITQEEFDAKKKQLLGL